MWHIVRYELKKMLAFYYEYSAFFFFFFFLHFTSKLIFWTLLHIAIFSIHNFHFVQVEKVKCCLQCHGTISCTEMFNCLNVINGLQVVKQTESNSIPHPML